MIAVTFAHPSESRDFVRLFGERHPEVKVFHTGIGPTAGQARFGTFLDAHEFDVLISSGFAGAADSSLGVGDLLLAENFSDPGLLRQAAEELIARTGKLVTTDRIIGNALERERFAREQGAAALDMETAWIARACAERSLRLLSLRAISDTAAAPFPAPPDVLFDLERQKTNRLRLTSYLARHPVAIARLMRFARQIARARVSLTSALVLLVREL